MTDYERRQQIEKVLEAINALQQQTAAMYGEVMRMSARISDALKQKDTLDLVERAGRRGFRPGNGEPSRYAVGMEDGSERELANLLGYLEAGTEGLAYEQDRYGRMNRYGTFTEATVRAVTARQEELLNQFPGFQGKVARRGGFASATVDGREYRLGRGDNGSLQLKRLEGGAWVPVAERVATARGSVGTFWARTDRTGSAKARSAPQAEARRNALADGMTARQQTALRAVDTTVFRYDPYEEFGMNSPVRELLERIKGIEDQPRAGKRQ
jgi:hypothetical protein